LAIGATPIATSLAMSATSHYKWTNGFFFSFSNKSKAILIAIESKSDRFSGSVPSFE